MEKKRKKAKYGMGLVLVVFFLLFIPGHYNILQVDAAEQTAKVPAQDTEITLGFAGDMNLDENWATTKYLDQQPNGIADCFSPNLMQQMQEFDIFMLNNEFTYSKRGKSLKNKQYTFRADPARVGNLQAMGVDIVLLANNHVYDYGKNAFLDTLQTLQDAGIHYVGAGKDIAEASKPYYFTCKGKKIAYVAASEAEKLKMTPQATKTMPGILRCYDTSMFLAEIAEADAQADYVIANVHWGTEYDNMASKEQREFAREMIDAGADAVIGTHPHVLQGMEFYQGKPIIYSLGNFWFNDKDLYSGMLALTLTVPEDGSNISLKTTRFVPCLQYDLITTEPTDAAQRQEIIDFEQKISYGVTIDADAIVME